MQGFNPVKSFCQASKFTPLESDIIDAEIQKLLDMKVISEVDHHPNEFISPVFIVPKKDGEYRMILNLKELNQYIEYHHFKMDTFESVLKLVKPGCFFASIDVRHAYYSVPMAAENQVKLRFQKSGKLYQFQSLPNGISCAPKQFTRLMKPVYASLRMLGHTNSGYIDDSLLLADTYSECEDNVSDTVDLMTKVGFMIHEKKSVFKPTRQITFLGNNIDSEKMIVTLPEEKVVKIVQECSDLYSRSYAKIVQVARILGLLVSTFSAVEFAQLHYRDTERAKILALQENRGDYESTMFITQSMKTELKWWIDNLAQQKRHICHGTPSITIYSDASKLGWGATCGDIKIGGRWNDQEAQNHINYLELLAVSLAVKSFCKTICNCHVQVKCDNQCSQSYISHMGGKIEKLNLLARHIWLWCIDRSIWLSAAYVRGIENFADESSRKFKDNIEWMLDEQLFFELTVLLGKPEIDMFASRLNKQLSRYVAWMPDPEAEAIDAFALDWKGTFIYAFPPFSLVSSVVRKTIADEAEVLLVAPVWVTQNWYTAVLELLIDHPVIIKVKQNTLKIQGSNKIHPLVNRLHLMACRISGKRSKTENFQKSLLKSLWHRGDDPPKSNIHHTSGNGFSSVVKGKQIFFRPLLN